jgi:PTH1 family peptidyl-tRNA hydrolase
LKLIVGLGNPGAEYADTRHNVGFWVIDELASRHDAKLRQSAKWHARTARYTDGTDGKNEDVLLVEPTTFMNLSGRAVRELVTFYKIPVADVLVMLDDADLPLGKLRIRMSGSAGGHNGLKSIIQDLGTQQFSRLRVGVGRQTGELRNHVLGRFGAEEREPIGNAVKRAADAAEMFVTAGILKVMNTFNAPDQGEGPDRQDKQDRQDGV